MTRVSDTTLFAVIVDKTLGHANSQRAQGRTEPPFDLKQREPRMAAQHALSTQSKVNR